MKKGFTLAEVLITLGIVGVISAMTIPGLISKFDKMIIEANLKKTYSELQNWLKLSQEDFTEFTAWDFGALATGGKLVVDTYMSPYMRLTPCGGKHRKLKCFVDEQTSTRVGFYKPTETKAPGAFIDTFMYSVVTQDGRALGLWTEWHTDWDGKYLEICVDVNGRRGKSIMGQDVFCFNINNFRTLTMPPGQLNVGVLNGNKSTEALVKNCITDQNGRNCGILLWRNNWKFPHNYPIKF